VLTVAVILPIGFYRRCSAVRRYSVLVDEMQGGRIFPSLES
jgi:hypothetical protein